MKTSLQRIDLILLGLLAAGFAVADWQCRRSAPACAACESPLTHWTADRPSQEVELRVQNVHRDIHPLRQFDR